jgi:hypothetical protein
MVIDDGRVSPKFRVIARFHRSSHKPEVSIRLNSPAFLTRLHGYETDFSPIFPLIVLQNTNCWSLELAALQFYPIKMRWSPPAVQRRQSTMEQQAQPRREKCIEFR